LDIFLEKKMEKENRVVFQRNVAALQAQKTEVSGLSIHRG
jgi:hypothetical protein